MNEFNNSAQNTEIESKMLHICILLSSIGYGIWCACERLIARDEGFYAFAVQLVSRGEVPYRDFFYPQMPLLPYIYSLLPLSLIHI